MKEEEDDSEEVDGKMREFDASSPCEFPSGQMVWARVGGAPFWPSVVVADPDLLLSTRVSAKGSGFAREYHVQGPHSIERKIGLKSALILCLRFHAFAEKN